MSSCCSTKIETTPAAALASPKVHIHLHSDRLAESVAFYRAFFGEEPVKSFSGYSKFLPSWAPVNLALSHGPAADGAPIIGHLGIQLADPATVRTQLSRVKAAGLEVREEMGVDCCHSNQDKFWVTDPIGVEWEVYFLNHDLAAGAAPASSTACCTK